ncbi:inner centromere protein-like [Seriola aureovittata]|uniref:inner centromere protein-like n=1 Tax=Seriola aureovittata TaxID=2871759 RepID=UPI0024BECBBF|nr:inner centromere protein-like [Seriola aureovittata]
MDHIGLNVASGEAGDETLGPHFIDVEEIIDVNEELQDSEEEERDINEREELRRRLCLVKTRYRQERELHDHMFKHGLALEELMNETAAENKYLTSKMKEFQQQMANIRKMWEEEDEEALRQELLSEEENTVKSQLIYIRKKEKENQKLRERNEELTAELHRVSVGDIHRGEIQTLRAAEQKYKKFVILIKKNNEEYTEYFNTIQDLRQEQRELQDALSSRHEEHAVAALNLQNESETLSEQRQPQVSLAEDKDDVKHKDERPLKTESWWHRCAKALRKGVKVAGIITPCVLLSVGLMVYTTPDCLSPDPDCSLWNIAFDLLLSYSELCHTHTPVY